MPPVNGAELGYVRWRDGGQARVIDGEIPFKMWILDRKVALLPLDLELLYDGMLLVRDPTVIAALVRVRRRHWRTGHDPAVRPDHGQPDGPPAHLRPILECLLSGLPDDRAAAHLGISARTYSRRVAELLTLLRVGNRFAAGVQAARRRWLEPHHHTPPEPPGG